MKKFVNLVTVVNEIEHQDLKVAVEHVIRRCIGERPGEWKVWISVSRFGYHHHVILKGPVQTREHLFFEAGNELPLLIHDWLMSYPLR